MGIQDLCSRAGISVSQYYRRRKKGMTHEEALRITVKNTRYKGDKEMDCIKVEQIKKAGISKSQYYYRRRKGMTHEEALCTPVKDGYKKKNETITKKLQEKDINIDTYYNRICQMGMTPEEAIKTPKMRKAGIIEQCKAAGITYACYYNRIKHGMTHEEALSYGKGLPRGELADRKVK